MSGDSVGRLARDRYDPRSPTAEQTAWQQYVQRHPQANLYHTLTWRDLIGDVFGHQSLFIAARRGGETVGVLPAFRIRFPLLGTKVVSLPYEAGSGGPLADDAAAERSLIAELVSAARTGGAHHVEIRTLDPPATLAEAGFAVTPSVLHSDVDLREGDVWKRVGKDQQQKVRKAERAGVRVRVAESAADFDAYYQVYLRAFHAFGTPPYGPGYYPALHSRLQADGSVVLFLAEHEGKAVGGYILFRWGSRAVNKIAAVLPSALSLGVFPALYGAALTWCVENGIDWLSYGTSARSDTGLIAYKERWGATTRPVYRCVLPIKGTPRALEDYYDPDALSKRAWKRLPRFVTPPLGHLLNRWFA